MAAPQLLGLPPMSSDLKSILPYLQRADELKQKDPVMAYWCAYYAAQLGISLKAKDTASRTLLFELLGTLEKMKVAIGPNDAIDFEAASAAYVENFALRVFGAADDEDRKSIATRATAKKFLAAANFLEILKVFPKSDVSDSTDQKIRYSKWKAADIAKAFREGRKPEPGPPGATEELFNPPVVSIVSSGSPKTASPIGSHSPPKRSPPDSAPHTPHKPPQLDPSSLGPRWGGDVTPGSWSTAATPGSPRNLFSTVSDTFYHDPESPSAAKAQRDKKRTGSGSSSGSGSGSTASIGPKGGRRSSVSSGSPNGKKSVHFTPSVSGGLSSTDGSAPSSPASEIRHVLPEDIYAPTVHTPSTIYHEPQPSTPPLPPNLSNIYVSPAPPPAVPPAPQPSTYSPNSIYAPSGPAFSSPSIPQAEPVILTPAIIAKAQKHCRFAISSLDYEDAEQARKELRAALSALGG